MSYMFNGCNNLATLDVSVFDTFRVTNMYSMFNGCKNLTNLEGTEEWDTSKVTNMSHMFNGCNNLATLDLSDWKTSEVTNMGGMFQNCSSLTSLDLSDWDTSKVTNMGNMFQNCNNLTSLDSMMNISTSLDLSYTILDTSSLLDVIDNLTTLTTTQILIIGKTLLTKLTEEQIAVAVNKGWTVE